jgi:signal peptidase I
MKRAIGLVLLIIACVLGFLTIKGTLPFMPILGHSMEPTLQSGSLLTIEPVNPGDVKVGDIIIYNVPTMVREYYNYPPVVSHRVIEVKTVPSIGFRTKGDNTGEDPFTVRPIDIRGTVGKQIPYLGLPLLFFQSQQGLIFVAIALVLLTVFLYGGELLRGGNLLHRGLFAPVINEEKRANRLLTRKIEDTEKKIDTTEQALEKFSTAIAEYAQHLASHTSAVQGLAEASHELKRGAAEQNHVLMSLMQRMGQTPSGQETVELPAPLKPQSQPRKEAEEIIRPLHVIPAQPVTPGCARKQAKPTVEVPAVKKETPTPLNKGQDKQGLTKEALAAQQEVYSALDRLHRKLDRMKSQE